MKAEKSARQPQRSFSQRHFYRELSPTIPFPTTREYHYYGRGFRSSGEVHMAGVPKDADVFVGVRKFPLLRAKVVIQTDQTHIERVNVKTRGLATKAIVSGDKLQEVEHAVASGERSVLTVKAPIKDGYATYGGKVVMKPRVADRIEKPITVTSRAKAGWDEQFDGKIAVSPRTDSEAVVHTGILRRVTLRETPRRATPSLLWKYNKS